MTTRTQRHWLTGEEETVEIETGVFRYGKPSNLDNTPTKGIPAISATHPLVSTALAVVPAQSAAMNKSVQEAGISDVHYRADGKCVFESRAGRNAELKRRERFDGDAGYGDHAGS